MGRSILLILLLLGAALIGFLYLRPTWEEFQALRKTNADLENLSAELDGLISNRDIMLQKINSVSKENLERIEKTLPKTAQITDFLTFLEELAGKYSLELRASYESASEARGKILSNQPLPAAAISLPGGADAIQELAGSINISGSYETLRSFLADLERNLRITDINSIAFGSPPETKQQFQFSLNLKSYYK